MGLINRLFGRPGKKNALVLMSESNSELRQLLFLEKKHSADLLQQLTKALGNHSETVTKEIGTPTPKQAEIIAFVKTNQKVTAAQVQEALHYKHRATASGMLSEAIKKGLIQRHNRGKLSCYSLP